MEPILRRPLPATNGRFVLNFPQRDSDSVCQDEEVCEVTYDGETQLLRFHDYAEIFAVPGLYEHLFYDELECCSPEVVSAMLADEVERRGASMGDLRIFDVGAGNGMVGEQLRDRGADVVVGADILEEAGAAADARPPGRLRRLPRRRPHRPRRRRARACWPSTTSTAWSPSPRSGSATCRPEAFRAAYDMISDGGLVALHDQGAVPRRRRAERVLAARAAGDRRRGDGRSSPAAATSTACRSPAKRSTTRRSVLEKRGDLSDL